MLLATLRSWVTMLVSSSLIVQWSTSLFDHLMRLPLAFFEKRHVGDVISRFGSLDAVRETLTTRAVMALLDGVMSIALVVMMYLYGERSSLSRSVPSQSTRSCASSPITGTGPFPKRRSSTRLRRRPTLSTRCAASRA